jgi:hypothetical protein
MMRVCLLTFILMIIEHSHMKYRCPRQQRLEVLIAPIIQGCFWVRSPSPLCNLYRWRPGNAAVRSPHLLSRFKNVCFWAYICVSSTLSGKNETALQKRLEHEMHARRKIEI